MSRPGAAPFVVFEGTEGSGKSTQVGLLVARLRAAGVSVLATREPGGTAIGEQIRLLLLDPGNCAMLAETETLLYAAARAQHVREVVMPALAAGVVVVSDRYVDSSVAYQGAGRGLPVAADDAIQSFATGGLKPDVRVLLDLPLSVGLQRRLASAQVDRLDAEHRSFHERVRAAFLGFARDRAPEWIVVDANGDPAEVGRRVWEQLHLRLGARLSVADLRDGTR